MLWLASYYQSINQSINQNTCMPLVLGFLFFFYFRNLCIVCSIYSESHYKLLYWHRILNLKKKLGNRRLNNAFFSNFIFFRQLYDTLYVFHVLDQLKETEEHILYMMQGLLIIIVFWLYVLGLVLLRNKMLRVYITKMTTWFFFLFYNYAYRFVFVKQTLINQKWADIK